VTWLIHMCDMTHSYVCHDSFICKTWHIHMWHGLFTCDMTHSYVIWHTHMWHDSFIRDMTHSYVWHDSLCLPVATGRWLIWHIHMCDMTHSYVWHDTFMCVPWLIHMCDMTHSYVQWYIHMCDMTHSYVWHMISTSCDWEFGGSLTMGLNPCCHTAAFEAAKQVCVWVMSHVWMSHVTHVSTPAAILQLLRLRNRCVNESYHTYE